MVNKNNNNSINTHNTYNEFNHLSQNTFDITHKTSKWSNIPTIQTINPLSGSIKGNTIITIHGKNLNNIISCRFILNNMKYVTSTHMNINNEITCIAPPVKAIGRYTLDLNFNNNIWISTKYTFHYYLTPYFFNSITINIYDKNFLFDFDVFGENIPLELIYCRIGYLSSIFILSGIRFSDTHLRCLQVK